MVEFHSKGLFDNKDTDTYLTIQNLNKSEQYSFALFYRTDSVPEAQILVFGPKGSYPVPIATFDAYGFHAEALVFSHVVRAFATYVKISFPPFFCFEMDGVIGTIPSYSFMPLVFPPVNVSPVLASAPISPASPPSPSSLLLDPLSLSPPVSFWLEEISERAMIGDEPLTFKTTER